MGITLTKENVQSEFKQMVLEAWQGAHGTTEEQIYLFWNQGRIVVIIEDVLFKGERLLAQGEEGRKMLEQYLVALLAQVVDSHKTAWSEFLGHVISDTSISANPVEQWVMIILRLGT